MQARGEQANSTVALNLESASCEAGVLNQPHRKYLEEVSPKQTEIQQIRQTVSVAGEET